MRAIALIVAVLLAEPAYNPAGWMRPARQCLPEVLSMTNQVKHPPHWAEAACKPRG